MSAQVHRFGDCVAASLGTGETVYLTPKDAKKLARTLNACASNVKASRFVDSEFTTVGLELEDTGHNGTGYKIKRAPLGNCPRTLAIYKPGQPMPGVNHAYHYAGAVPCTGRQVCHLCGSEKP